MATASAQRVYRLGLAVGGVGAGAVVLAVAVALRSLDEALTSVHVAVTTCGDILGDGSGAEASLVFGLSAVGATVVTRAARSLVGQLREARGFVSKVTVRDRVAVAGEPVIVIDSRRAEAFCSGYLKPRVYVSHAALTRLSRDELEAVIAHERHHEARRDPLRLLLVRVLRDGLFFLPAMHRLTERYGALAELAADEAAVRAKGRRTLASALLAFGEGHASDAAVGIAPERVDQLLGRPPAWDVPVSLLAGAAVTIGACSPSRR